MAIAREGSAELYNTYSRSGTATSELSVPSGATYALIFCTYYIGSAAGLDSCSIGSSAATKIVEGNFNDWGTVVGGVCIYAIKNPPTGTQNFSWQFGAALDEPSIFAFVYFSGVDISGTAAESVRDSDKSYHLSDASVTLTTQTGDKVYGVAYSYGTAANAAPTGSNQASVISQNTDVNSYNSLAVGEESGGSSSTTFNETGAYVGLAAVALKQAASGGATYNETITNSASSTLSGSSSAVFQNSLSFSAGGAMSDQGPLTMGQTLSFASVGELGSSASNVMSQTLTMSALAALTDTAGLTGNPTISLSGISTLESLLSLTANPAITLTADGQLVCPLDGTVYTDILTFATLADLIGASTLTASDQVTLTTLADLAGSSQLTSVPTATLLASSALSGEVQITLLPSITLSTQAAIDAASLLTAVPVVALSAAAELLAGTGNIYLGEVTFDTVASFVSSLGAGTSNLDATLSAVATVLGTDTGILVASATLAAAAGLVGEGTIAAVLGDHDGVYLIVKLSDNLVFMKKLD